MTFLKHDDGGAWLNAPAVPPPPARSAVPSMPPADDDTLAALIEACEHAPTVVAVRQWSDGTVGCQIDQHGAATCLATFWRQATPMVVLALAQEVRRARAERDGEVQP